MDTDSQASAKGTFAGWINPLQFLEVDDPWASLLLPSGEAAPPTTEQILAFLCEPGSPNDAASLVARYKEISVEPQRLFVAPSEPNILAKLVWPLRHAKASYTLGNHIGVVALCGMVAEMVAILTWKLAEPTFAGRKLAEGTEAAVLGSEFERLGQERRVRVLQGLGLIPDDVAALFTTIRLARSRYLHRWSEHHGELANQARDCYHAAVALVVGLIGQDIRDGMVLLNPLLVEYLRLAGQVEPRSEE